MSRDAFYCQDGNYTSCCNAEERHPFIRIHREQCLFEGDANTRQFGEYYQLINTIAGSIKIFLGPFQVKIPNYRFSS